MQNETTDKVNPPETATNHTERSSLKDLGELFAAMSAVQNDLKPVPKRGKSHHGPYATLDDILDGVGKAYNKAGFSVLQLPRFEQNTVHMTTVIGFKNGSTVRSTMSMPCDGSNPQKIGSVMTYLRRYMLASMLGIASETDDDANSAVPSAPRGVVSRPKGMSAKRIVNAVDL